jgi:hypothetical protein
MGAKSVPELLRFNQKYIPEPNTGCWLWTACVGHKGYGLFSNAKRIMVRAHRHSYGLFKGIIPHNMEVCHRCDTPACVNPDHLWLGTRKENSADSWNKGRAKIPHQRVGA